MSLKTAELIIRLANIDAPLTGRQLVKRFEENDLHAEIGYLPMNVLNRWVSPLPNDARSEQARYLKDKTPAMVRALKTNLELFLGAALTLPRSTSDMLAGPLLWQAGAAGETVDHSDVPLLNCLALLVSQLCEDELALLTASAVEEDDKAAWVVAMTPLIFCTAWYLAWQSQESDEFPVRHLIKFQALYLASVLKDNFAGYASMTGDWVRKDHQSAVGFGETVPASL